MRILRKWPRWLQWGLLSIGAAGVLILTAALAGLGGLKDVYQLSIGGGVLAPFIFIDSLPLPELGIASAFTWIFGFGFWFLVGALGAMLSKKTQYAWVLWIIVYIPASLYTFAWAFALN